MDRRVLTVFLLLWSSDFFISGLWTEDSHSSTVVPDDVRLVGGNGPCDGRLEERRQWQWRQVGGKFSDWTLTSAAAVCRKLNCGSVVSVRRRQSETDIFYKMEIKCSDSVRLVDGTNRCSGRLEVKSNQLWSSVCEDGFDQQDAEVVCRELSCGAPSVLQGALYGGVEAPVWTKEFQCDGHESALLDCDSSDRNTCSSGEAAGLSCSEPGDVRLVGGTSSCGGTLEVKHLDEWRTVSDWTWNLRLAGKVCRELDCGSAVSTRGRKVPQILTWEVSFGCDAPSLMKCDIGYRYPSTIVEVTCSDSVRLVNGTNLCSGRLEVKSNQLWSSVCEDGFDQQDAEVVCRELSCGAPSVLQGALYGGVEAPVWTKEFQCDGHESALLDCDSSDRNTCSSGEAVGLSCSDPDEFRLVGGASRCSGRLELKHLGDWKAVISGSFTLKAAAVICRQLDCGSAVSVGEEHDSLERPVWWIELPCVQSESTLKDCVVTAHESSSYSNRITCSDSVRLVDGTNRCSGRLVVKSNQLWSSVCEDGFDQQDAEVVCRELSCGAPSVLQGALYGGVEAPVWNKEFQCDGHESALLDCDSSDRNTCSSGEAAGLSCSDSDSIRLVGEASRCAGTLDMKLQGEWRPGADWDTSWNQKSAAAVCRQLDCGSVVSTSTTDSSERPVWWISSSCLQPTSALSECVVLGIDINVTVTLEVICSDLLVQPNISSSSTDGVSKAKQQGLQVFMGSSFTITCSIEPQYPGGSFQLIVTDTSQSYTLPAVNHSAHFLFSAADHTHQGDYRCVYHVYVFSYNFSSESQPLVLTVSGSLTELIVRHVVGLLGLMSLTVTVVYFHSKASTIQKQGRETNTESNDAVLGGRSPEERVIMSTVLDSRSAEMQ